MPNFNLKLYGIVFFIAASFLAACSTSESIDGKSAYGEQPVSPKERIATASNSTDVVLFQGPQPHYMHVDGNWLYGWRVCTLLNNGQMAGFFLMRGEKIIYQDVAPMNQDALIRSVIPQNCPLNLSALD